MKRLLFKLPITIIKNIRCIVKKGKLQETVRRKAAGLTFIE